MTRPAETEPFTPEGGPRESQRPDFPETRSRQRGRLPDAFSIVFVRAAGALSRKARVPIPNASSAPEVDVGAFHEARQDEIRRVYDVHGAVLLREVRRHVGAAEAEAVVHEVFVELLRNRALRTQFTGGSMLSWLREIARFKSLEHLRRAGRYVTQNVTEPTVAPEADLEARDLLSKFVDAAVPAAQRQFFGLRFIERRTQVEIANSLGIPRSTLEGWEHGLIRKLRAFVLGGTTT
jgi:RNA polymerase sigma factor (sigma-70 family)